MVGVETACPSCGMDTKLFLPGGDFHHDGGVPESRRVMDPDRGASGNRGLEMEVQPCAAPLIPGVHNAK
jgi:hypothetical protein